MMKILAAGALRGWHHAERRGGWKPRLFPGLLFLHRSHILGLVMPCRRLKIIYFVIVCRTLVYLKPAKDQSDWSSIIITFLLQRFEVD